MLTDAYYAPSAYRFTPASEEEIKAYTNNYTPPAFLRQGLLNRGKFIKILLLICPAKKTIPYNIFNAKTPQNLREEQQKPLQQPQKTSSHITSDYNSWNETSICFKKESKLHSLFSFLLYFSLFILLIGVPFIYILLKINSVDITTDLGFTPFIFLVTGTITIAIASYFLRKLLPQNGLGHEYIFNRRTGLVSKLKYPLLSKHPKPQITSIPFTEMEGVIYTYSDSSNIDKIELIFQHRLSPFSFTLSSDCGILLLIEHCASDYWQFIQNFMDINKPLPDIPLFEKYRHKDPSTAEYDQKKCRKQDYWLTITDQLWEDKQNANERRSFALRNYNEMDSGR